MAYRGKLKARATHIQWLFLLGLGILVFRLAQLQLWDPRYKIKAEATIIDREIITPARGLLYDRSGNILVHNSPTYDILVRYNALDPRMDTARLCQIFHLSREAFARRIEKDWRDKRYSKWIPFYFLKNVPPQYVHRFVEYQYAYPGFEPRLSLIRAYPHHSAAHVLGYLNEVTKEVVRDSGGLYQYGDFIGVSGVEKYYEPLLRGEKGVRIVLKDNKGTKVKVLEYSGARPPKAGEDLHLSIDLELQHYAESLMQGKSGAIVAIEPSSGEILAMVSAPFYDPNILTLSGRDRLELKKLQEDSLKPFFNRAIMANYPPASTIKPLIALIAMQEKAISPYTVGTCPGYYRYKEFTYGCHLHPKPRNVMIALQHSCNSYFFMTFRRVLERDGPQFEQARLDILVDYLYEAGLGRRLGIDIHGESAGFIPSREFYDALYHPYRWSSTYIMSIAIGQGELLTTPLQLANIAAIIANRGYYYTPHFIRQIGDGTKPIPLHYRRAHRLSIDTALFAPVIEGMRRSFIYGTATSAYSPHLAMAGKTGTAQNPHGKDHSLFIGFAPIDTPKIAVAVVVENAGSGGKVAAPIASLIMEKYVLDTVYRRYLEYRMRKLRTVPEKNPSL